jgi:adenine phosphoribosyltransferase
MNLSIQKLFPNTTSDLYPYIRTVPDFPKPGIAFKDIMPLLAEPTAFAQLIGLMAGEIRAAGATKIIGLEARGFLIGVAIAQELGLPFVAARKGGKLPGETLSINYDLEYGKATLEIQKGAIQEGDKIAIVDDLLATGGTARAAVELIRQSNGVVCGTFFAIELSTLGGRSMLNNIPTSTVLTF